MVRKLASTCQIAVLLCSLTVAIPGDGIGASVVDGSATVRLRSETTTSLRTGDAFRNGPKYAEAAVNESAAIDVCRDYLEAQFEYFRSHPGADGVLAFAHRIRSTPGKHDGLYWPINTGEVESPLGPNVAAAAITELRPGDESRPVSGFYVKVLRAQGAAAVGGPRNYVVGGRLLAGFGLIVWPAQYRVTGVQSFIVNHLGDVYARDLGPQTSRIASSLSVFNPDHSWTKVASRDEDR